MMPNRSDVKKFYNEIYYKTLKPNHTRHIKNLVKKLGIKNTDSILDIGCGLGEFLKECSKITNRIYGIDISKTAINECSKQYGFYKVQFAEELKYKDMFDYITCLGSFEHFLNMGKSLQNIREALKKDGKLLILVPNKDFLAHKIGLFRGTEQIEVKETMMSVREWVGYFEAYGFNTIESWNSKHIANYRWVMKKGVLIAPIKLIQMVSTLILPKKYGYCTYYLLQKIDN